MIGTLPEQNTSASMAESPETEPVDCAICQHGFAFARPVRITICNHTFHETCLNKWFNFGNTCPLCRTILANRVITPNDLVDNPLDLEPFIRMTQEMTPQERITAVEALLPDNPLNLEPFILMTQEMTPQERIAVVALLAR